MWDAKWPGAVGDMAGVRPVTSLVYQPGVNGADRGM